MVFAVVANICCLLADLIPRRLSIWTIDNNSRSLFLLNSSLISLAIYSILLKRRFDLLVSIFVIRHCRMKTIEAWTGWEKDQFHCMLQEVIPYLRSSTNRNPIDALAIFWIKLKTNVSFWQTGSLFNFPGNILHYFSNVLPLTKGKSKTLRMHILFVLYLYAVRSTGVSFSPP